MAILIACEESQIVTKAFREKGVETFSCDILPCSGGRPEWHIQDDVILLLKKSWDMIIAFPPCTHLCSSGAQYWPEKQKDGRQEKAFNFVLKIYYCKLQIYCNRKPCRYFVNCLEKTKSNNSTI